MPYGWLAFLYWLHMLATVVLVGSLSVLTWLILPAARKVLSSRDRVLLFEAIHRRLEGLFWFSLGVLVVTGLFQMSAHPNYSGFLSASTRWSIALLVKHLLVIAVIVFGAIQTWEIFPSIQRALLRPERLSDVEWQALERRQRRLLHFNFVLSLLILAVTALARVS